MSRLISLSMACVSLLLLSACGMTGVKVGGSDTGPATGSAGSAGTQASTSLSRCNRPKATVLLELSQGQDKQLILAHKLPPDPLPAMRLIAQQTNCFRIVHRSAAMMRERELQRSGETATSRFSRGQMVAADYVVMVELILDNPNKSGMGGLMGLGSIFGPVGLIAGAAAGAVNTSEAGVVLTLVDNRSSLQIASASGSASGTSFALAGMLGIASGGIAALGGAGGYENTDQGKVVMGAMVDAVNKLVPHVPNDQSAPTASQVVPDALVRDIQEALRDVGYQLSVDGLYGPGTKRVISEYQGKNGLLVDGKATPELLVHIRTKVPAVPPS